MRAVCAILARHRAGRSKRQRTDAHERKRRAPSTPMIPRAAHASKTTPLARPRPRPTPTFQTRHAAR